MATINGTHVNFVKVPTMTKFNDITTKADGTIYFIVDAKKIYLDGVMYGFNDSDIDLSPFLKHNGTIPMTGDLEMDSNGISLVTTIRGADEYQGTYLDFTFDGDVVIGSTDLELSGEGESSYARFSTKGLEFSNVYNGAKIKGLSYLTVEDYDSHDAFEATDPTQAVPYGTLQSLKGSPFGFAELDSSGQVLTSQLPSYVDDIIEVNNYASLPATGEKGKLYVTIDNNHLYRWSGSAWVNVSDGNAHLTLGTTSSTAYRGDHGLYAYNHTKLDGPDDNPHDIQKGNVGLGNVENYGIASKAQAEAGSSNVLYMTPQRTKEAIEKLAPKLAWTVVA